MKSGLRNSWEAPLQIENGYEDKEIFGWCEEAFWEQFNFIFETLRSKLSTEEHHFGWGNLPGILQPILRLRNYQINFRIRDLFPG